MLSLIQLFGSRACRSNGMHRYYSMPRTNLPGSGQDHSSIRLFPVTLLMLTTGRLQLGNFRIQVTRTASFLEPVVPTLTDMTGSPPNQRQELNFRRYMIFEQRPNLRPPPLARYPDCWC